MRQIICPETSVRNYYYSLRNNPQERSSYLIEALHVFITSNLLTGNALPHPNLSHHTHYFSFISHTVHGCRQNFSSPEDGSTKSTYELGFKLKTLATPTNAQFYKCLFCPLLSYRIFRRCYHSFKIITMHGINNVITDSSWLRILLRVAQDLWVPSTETQINYLYCCTLHFEDSPNITQPTNAPIIYYVLV